MRKRAEHDALTGLLNRAEYEMRIDHFFHENENPLGIFIILDIDNFKAINDTFGHVTGDQVLYAVGEHLRNLFPETTHIARIGGDEFSLFIPYVLPLAQLHTKMSSLCHPITLPVKNITLACSAGVCYSPQNGMNHNDLYRNADMALMAAKRHEKSQYEFFHTDMEMPMSAAFEHKTLQLLDHASEAMFVCDASTSEILYINETAARILGKSKDSCLGKRCYPLFGDQCRNCDRCHHIDRHKQDFYEETTFLKDNKTPVHIKARLEDWEGKKVKVHYLQIGAPIEPVPMEHIHPSRAFTGTEENK